MRLFDKFDNVYCINLSHRTDRLENFTKEVQKYDLGEFERFDAVNGEEVNVNSRLLKGEIGIIQSVIELMEDAIDSKYDEILVIEDDCVFNSNITHVDEFLSQVPKDYEMIYFGGNHNTHMGTPPPFPVNKNVIRLHNTYAAHCISIRKNMFPIILKEISKFQEPLDVVYQRLQSKHKIYGLNPGVATQREDFSDIQKKVVNYDWLIK